MIQFITEGDMMTRSDNEQIVVAQNYRHLPASGIALGLLADPSHPTTQPPCTASHG